LQEALDVVIVERSVDLSSTQTAKVGSGTHEKIKASAVSGMLAAGAAATVAALAGRLR